MKQRGRFHYFAIAVLAIVLLGLGYATWVAQLTDRQMRADLQRQAQLIARAVHFERLASLRGRASDTDRPEYRRLKQQLGQLRQLYPEFRFIYLMGHTPENEVFFFVDSEPVGAPDESPSGQPYPEASPTLRQVFDTGRAAVEGPLSDRWGTWISALVPIREPRTSQVHAVLGIDVEASAWQTRILSRTLSPIGFTGLLLLVLIAGRALLRWRHELSEARSQAWLPRNLEGLIAAGCGLLLTVMLASEFQALERQARRETFTSLAVENATRMIEAMQDSRDYQLASLARFLTVNPRVNLIDFLAYTQPLTRNVAMEGWAWVPVVPAEERERIVLQARADGFPWFFIWQRTADGRQSKAHGRDIYYPVLYMAPMSDNATVLGYDLGSETSRRVALEEAAATGLSTATDPIGLIYPPDAGLGIMVITPVFSRAIEHDLLGFALGVFRLDALMRHAADSSVTANDVMHIDLYQLRADTAPSLLASSTDDDAVHELPRYRLGSTELDPLMMPFLGFGKTYALAVEPGSAFAELYPARAFGLTLAGGLLLTAVLAAFFDVLGNRRHVLAQMVRARTLELQTSHEQLRKLSEQVPGTIYQYRLRPDGSSCFPYSSESLQSVYGLSPEDLRRDAAPVFERMHPDDRTHIEHAIIRSAETLRLWHEEFRVVLPDRGERWLEGRATPERLADGSTLWHGFITDITERKDVEANLLMERRRLAGIIEGTNVGTWEWNVQTGETVFNERWADIVGHTLAELEPISIRTWLELAHPDDLKHSEALLHAHFTGQQDFYDCECRMRHKDGHWVWVHDRGRVMTWTEDGKPLLMMGTHTDITERKRLEAELIALATTDPLTDLPNRRSFFARLEEEFKRLQRFPEPPVAVLMFDLDHFKRINDRHGHDVGDEVLVHFADLLRQRLRKTDMAGRLGGEEFAVIMIGSGADDARRFADEFRETLKAHPLRHGNRDLKLTTSIGVSLLRPNDSEADNALLRADAALYRAKQQGRDRVELA